MSKQAERVPTRAQATDTTAAPDAAAPEAAPDAAAPEAAPAAERTAPGKAAGRTVPAKTTKTAGRATPGKAATAAPATVKQRTRSNRPPDMLPKSERRKLGKAAAAKRAAARRRRRVLNVVGKWASVLAVLGALTVGAIALAGGFTSEPAPAVGATPDPRLADKPVVTAGEGDVTALKVQTLIEGNGPVTETGQALTVKYVGVTYKDGKEFDTNWDSDQTFPLTLGAGGVIPGWDQGLVGVKVGSRVQLDIPADLAYGENPGGGSPPGDLRFVVDVLSAS